MIHSFKNIIIPGAENLPISIDVFYKQQAEKIPVVIYAHGFNGFKDWGNFDLIAYRIAAEGFVLVKFNFSHNGTTPANPDTFDSLDAFGNNNYSKQLKDLELVTDWVCSPSNDHHKKIDAGHIYLIGHSMGGGIAILHAAYDKRIKKLVTWAAISECTTPWGSWPLSRLEEWKKSGIEYYLNSRTGQQMPLYYQLYEDYNDNQEKLDIKKAISKLSIPILLCHGTNDTSVTIDKMFELKTAQPIAEIFSLDTDHVFGRKHPWTETDLPAAMDAVVNKTISFLKEAG